MSLIFEVRAYERSKLQAQVLLIVGAIELLFPRQAKGITKAAFRGIVQSWKDAEAKQPVVVTQPRQLPRSQSF